MNDLDLIMDTNPWESVDDSIDKLISKRILELNPKIPDGDLNEVLDDSDNRAEAVDDLILKLIKIKKELGG